MSKGKRTTGIRLKGSLTVEATVLMPLVVWMLVFLIYIGFYYYNIGACTYVCFMNATTLLHATTPQKEQKPSLEMEQLEKRTIALENMNIQTENRSDEVEVVSRGTMNIPFVRKKLFIETSTRLQKLNQREFILQCNGIKELME